MQAKDSLPRFLLTLCRNWSNDFAIEVVVGLRGSTAKQLAGPN
jgi:hypothetical protein